MRNQRKIPTPKTEAKSYCPSFMTKFCSALYLENLLTNIFAKLNLRGGVSCMPAALLFIFFGNNKSVPGFMSLP